MRIIKIPFLVEAIRKHPKSRNWVENWAAVTRKTSWKNIQEVRATYPSADTVKAASGSNVVVFNVCGNDFRLITAIHYNRGIVYTLRFLTHAEYSKDLWKKEL